MGRDAVRRHGIDSARHDHLGLFPLSGVWAIDILLGIKLFFVGLIMVTSGSAVRAMADA